MTEIDRDPIVLALKAYEHSSAQNEKKAVLLTPQGGYFLYGNRFCEITEFELELVSDTLQIQGKSVSETLLFSVYPDGFQVTGQRPCAPSLVSLIFQIQMKEEEPLRGILLARGQKAKLVLFSDVVVEEVYRLARKPLMDPGQGLLQDEELRQYAESLRRNDLHSLIGLYLRGRRLKYLFDTMPGS